ncbi:MAG: maleylacetoacetate isomerase [Gammaproteobacteria bacterium]|nr:maleylacetoacetate isomerase [Gammaproteobacteria bacterium]
MKFYSYFRSSAAYRVRIALNLKGLDHEIIPVHLIRDGGEQNRPWYTAMNPLALVPTLKSDEGILTQSLAMMEYLEETHPEPPILPKSPMARARVRAIAQTVASEIHPLNNLRVLDYLTNELGQNPDSRLEWYRHWIDEGLAGIERLLNEDSATGRFCHGNTPTVADCCLIPQVYNARRFECPLDTFQTILGIEAACNSLDSFQQAAPDNQPDAE